VEALLEAVLCFVVFPILAALCTKGGLGWTILAVILAPFFALIGASFSVMGYGPVGGLIGCVVGGGLVCLRCSMYRQNLLSLPQEN
jgi:hypothetical protein